MKDWKLVVALFAMPFTMSLAFGVATDGAGETAATRPAAAAAPSPEYLEATRRLNEVSRRLAELAAQRGTAFPKFEGRYKSATQPGKTVAGRVDSVAPTTRPSPATVPATTQPLPDTTDLQVLFRKMWGGDTAARAKLIDVMRDPAEDPLRRQIAIGMLGQEGSKSSVIALTEMLLSEDRQLRTSAYYATRAKDRLADFSCSAAPTEATKRVIGERVAELRRETDK